MMARRVTNIALQLILVASSGCAVLKVDVDVYKGALANHEDVQKQQLAVMATAAKPLLISLRNGIEDPTRNWHDVNGYRDDYVPEARNLFKKEYARRINSVLSLYRDLMPPEALQFASEISGWSETYAREVRRLLRNRPSELTEDQKAWQRIHSGLKYADEGIERPKIWNDIVGGECANFIEAPAEYLTQSFRILVDASYVTEKDYGTYNSYAVQHSLYCLAKNPSTALKLGLQPSQVRELIPSAPNSPLEWSSNAYFEFVADPNNAKRYSAILFKSRTGAEAAEFETRLMAVATAYLNARNALSKLLERSIEVFGNVGSMDWDDFVQRPDLISEVLAESISQLTQVRYLVLSVCVDTWDIDADKRDLATRLAAGMWPDALQGQWRLETYAEAAAALKKMLLADPKGMVALMKASASALRKVPAGQDVKSCTPGINIPRDVTRRRPVVDNPFGREFIFGLARGPTIDPADEKRLEGTIDKSLRQVKGGSASGFERGRPNEGLETLIEKYLRDFANCHERRNRKAFDPVFDILSATQKSPVTCSEEQWNQTQQNLSDGLVHFSEKLLFVANYDPSLYSASGEETPSQQSSGGISKDARAKYVTLLQAVGNSILNQVDELNFRRRHEERLVDRAITELETLRRSISLPPKAVIDDLIADLKASASIETKRERDSGAEAKAILAGARDTELKKQQESLAAEQAKAKETKDALSNSRKLADHITAAHSTLSGTTAETKDDAENLKASVVTSKTDTADGAKMVDEIRDWLDKNVQAIEAAYQSQARPARLASTSSYLKDKRATIGPATAIARGDAFEAIVKNLKLNRDAGETAVLAAQKLSDEQAKAVEAASAKVGEAQAAVNSAKSDLAMAQKEAQDALASKTANENAVTAIQAAKSEVVEKLQNDPQADPDVVFKTLSDVLRSNPDAKLCGKNVAPAKTPSVCGVLDAVSGRTPPIGANRVYTGAINLKVDDARTVLDRMISSLEYERIQAARYSPTGGRVEQISQALKTAYEYRSGMAYLRPSGAYLRSSYPSTALQNDPEFRWKNLLLEGFVRSIPQWDSKVNQPDSKQVIQSEIDKQFWQNINSVRVSGGGQTNYVLTKDDIGNWYLKAYASDPKPIIDAAQKLALFSLGTKTGDFVGQLDKTREAQANAAKSATTNSSTTGSKTNSTDVPPLERLYTLHKTKYETQTKKDYDRLSQDLAPDQIATSIQDAWNKDDKLKDTSGQATKDALSSDLTAATTQLKTDWSKFSSDTKKPDEQASRFLDGLNSILHFRNALSKKIGADTTISDADKKKAAQTDLDQIIGPLLSKAVTSRQSTIKDFTTTVVYIGEVIE
jgi:hypothetical protein